MRIEIKGLPELQDTLTQAQSQLRPDGAFGRIMGWALGSLRDYAASITPVKTGRLRAGHEVSARGLEGRLSNTVPYAAKVHALGGHRAFYDRTTTEAAPEIMGRAVQMLGDEIF